MGINTNVFNHIYTIQTMKRLSIDITEDTHTKLKIKAAKENTTIKELINTQIEAILK